MSVARAQEEISSYEFIEWLAFERLEPGEPERGDYQAALIASTIANVNRTKKNKAYTIKDFLLNFSTPKVEVDQKALKTKFLAWKAVHEAALETRKPKRKGAKKC